MKPALIAGMLLLAASAPAAAATCPELTRLRADPRWQPLGEDNCELCIFNDVRIGPGYALRWNGRPVTAARMLHYLRLVRRMEPRPVTLLSVEASADCGAIAPIAALIAADEQCGPNNHCPYGFARGRRRH